MTCAARLSEDVVLALAGPDAAVPAGAPALRTAHGTLAVLAREEAHALTDLRTLLRSGPAAWPAAERAEALALLSGLLEHQGSAELAAALRQVRDALRERLARARPHDRRLDVEGLVAVDGTAFLLRGRSEPGSALTAISPEGERIPLDAAFRDPRRADRIICAFRTRAPSALSGWVVEGRPPAGGGVEVTVDAVSASLADLTIDLEDRAPPPPSLLQDHVAPVVAAFLTASACTSTPAVATRFGRPPADPDVSVIIPVGRRADLLEHQVLQFASDPALRCSELLLVASDPDERGVVLEVAEGLHDLHGLPFTVLEPPAPASTALACNAGAAVASGRRLLLLHPDVVPEASGWLDTLVAALDEDAQVAAAVPKLVYVDDLVDQAGLDVLEPSTVAGPTLRPRLRGLHRTVPAACTDARVAAADLACLLVDADAFRAAGGLAGCYAAEDHEGPDLCARLARLGRAVRYRARAELRHLEADERAGLGARRHDAWLHARRCT